MNRKKLKIITIFFMTLIIWIALKTISAAASFDASISSTNIKVGDTITVTVKANNAAGMYNVSTNNSNMSKISGDTSEFLEDGSTTITYKAVKAGTTTITAKASDMTDLDDDSRRVTGSKTFTVTIKSNETPNQEPPKEEPKKGTISSFYINGIKVKEFLNVTNKNSVSIKVNTSTKEGATVYNSLTKKSYKVKSGENKNIQILEGTNTLTITLESGATATRKIYSQKEEIVEPNIIEEKPEDVKVLLKSLLIKGINSKNERIELSFTPEFSSEVYEYKILLDETLEDITKLDIEAKAVQEDFIVEITGNEEIKEGENIVTITVKSKDKKTTNTYKIIVTKEAKTVPAVATTVEVEAKQEVVKPLWNRKQQILITIFTSIIALMGIAYAVIEYRYKKESEIKIPTPNTTLEEDMKKEIDEDKIGEIPFAKIGFEKEEDKGNIQDDKEKSEFKEIKNENEEDFKKVTKPKRGKHF